MDSQVMSPWSDSNEFITVFESVFQNNDSIESSQTGSEPPGSPQSGPVTGPSANQKSVPDYQLLVFARNKLTIWLTRMQQNIELSVNLIATKEIINALIEDQNNAKCDEEFRDESAVYSLYALSVIRFCTALSQYSNEDNMKSVKRLAHRYSCPQWIIDCRHNLCHSSVNQPTIDELRTAAMIGLNWLRQYFWLKVIDSLNVRTININRNYFDLIDDYLNNSNNNSNNNNKLKARVKNEIIIGLKQSRNEFITVFIQHLINANNCVTNADKTVNYESLKVPKLYLRKFSKLFTLIVNYNSVSILLNLLVKQFDCENRSKRHLAMSWFSTIIKAIDSDRKVSKFKSIFKTQTFNKVMPKIEWIRLLYSVSKRPNPKTSALILLISPFVSDVISNEKLNILMNLSKQYSFNAIEEDFNESNGKEEEFVVKTINDLKSTTDRINDSDFCSNDPMDWSKINFGASVDLA